MGVKELIINVSKGDIDAFEQLFNIMYDEVLAISYDVLLDRGLAEDAAQEAFVKIYRNAHRFDPFFNGQGWVKSIARRTAIDIYRRRKLGERFGGRTELDSDGVEELARGDDFEDGAIIATLSDDERIFVKLIAAGYKYSEIGKKHKWTNNHMNYLMKCAKKKIKAYLKRKP